MNVLDNPKKYFWVTLLQSASFLAPVSTLFYLHKGLDYAQLFILYAIIVVAMFFFEVPTGIIGDKYGRKTSIIIGLIGWTIFSVGLIFVHSFWGFVFLFILWGFNATCASGSDEAIIYDSLKEGKKESEMKKHMGRIMSARFLPLVIIAPIGSIIAKDLTTSQFNLLIIGNVLTTLIGLFIALTLVEPKSHSGAHEIRSPLSHFKESVKHIKKSPKLISLFMNKTLVLIPASHIFGLLWQPYLKSSNIPVALFGTITAVSAAIIFIMSRNIDKIEAKFSGKRVLFYTAALPFIAFLIGAFFQNILAALIFYFVIKIALWLRDPIFSQYMNQHIESHNRATVLSTLSMADSLFDIIIFISAGLITNISLSYAFIFSSLLILAALVFFRVTEEHAKAMIK